MNLDKARYLLDVNVLVALALGDHLHNAAVTQWFISRRDEDWGTCILTETGFLRVMTNPKVGAKSMEESKAALAVMEKHPSYRFWRLAESFKTLTAPFSGRIFGHQQLTDACLLGLAIREDCVLVTMDRTISHLAGPQHRQNLLVLQP